MRFAAPLALLVLLLVPLLVLLHVRAERERRRREDAAADRALLAGLVLADGDGGRGARLARTLLLAGAVALFSLALARPQFGMRAERHKARGIDLVVAIDLSRSMLARDVVPSRLERAKIELGALVDELRGDRVGLLGFTSMALPLCPLTVDHAAFKLQLRSAGPGDLPRGGTDISAAIEAGARMLDRSKSSGAARALLIITDGEDNEGDAVAAARKAHDDGIEIHVVGVGSRTGEPIPVLKDNGQIDGYLKDASGQTVVSRLNESLLRSVADTGGGMVALPGDVGGLDLGPVRTHLESLKKAELQERTIRVYEERFQWVLAPALVLLLLATVWRPTRRVRRVAVRGLIAAAGRSSIAALLAIGLGAAGARDAAAGPLQSEDPDARKGNKALTEGHAKEAVEHFGRAIGRLGDDPRVVYDRGLAEARDGELDKAVADLRLAMENGESAALRGQAAFALGNAYRRLKKWDEAITAYRRALVEDPQQTGARRNLEIAQREKTIAALQPHDPNKKNDENKEPPPDHDGGVPPDGGDQDSGSPDGGAADAGGGQPDGGGGDGGAADQQGAADGGAGADGGAPSGGEGQGQDGGVAQDGGAAPEPGQEAEPKDDDKQAAKQILDSLQEQEKALKRKRLLEKYKQRKVEKDW